MKVRLHSISPRAAGGPRYKSALGLALLLACGLSAAMASAEPGPTLMATGSYVGDGSNNRLIDGLSFRPDFVIVKHDAGDQAVARHRDMPDGMSKHLAGPWIFYGDRILGFEDGGFTVGSDQDVNTDGGAYYWIAFRESDDFKLGTYTGTGIDDTDITGVGLDPALVLVLSDSGHPWFRSTEMVPGFSLALNDYGVNTNLIQNLMPDGFQVGDDGEVNTADTVYYYLAFAEAPGRLHAFGRWGNGQDNYDLNGFGFEPQYALIKSSSGENGVHRPGALSGDRTLYFSAFAGFGNGIQAFLADGLELGNASTVNGSFRYYYGFAARSAPYTNLLVSLAVDDPSPVPGQEIRLTASVKSFGPDDAADVHVAIPLPDSLVFVGATPQAGSYDEGTGLWTLPDVSYPTSVSVEIRALVAPGAEGLDLSTTAALTALDIIDGIAADNVATAAIAVPGADLGLELLVDNAYPVEGETIQLGLSLTNHGPDAAGGIEIDAALVPGLAYVDHTAGQGSYLPGSGLWQVGSLDSGVTTGLAITATVEPGTAGSYLVQTMTRLASTPGDAVPDNDTASLAIGVDLVTETEIGVLIDSWIEELNPADNHGDTSEARVRYRPAEERMGLFRFDLDALPNGEVVQATLELTCKRVDATGDPVLVHRVTAPWDEMTVTWGSFGGAFDPAVEGSFSPTSTGLHLIDITPLVQGWQRGDHPNYGLLLEATSFDDGSQYYTREEPVAGRHPRLRVSIAGEADVVVDLSVDDNGPDENQLVTFTAHVGNAGPNAATGLALTHRLPPELSHESAWTSNGSYDPGTGLWDLGNRPAASLDTLIVTARVEPGAGGQVALDSLFVSALDQADPVPDNDAASIILDLQLAELSVAQSVSDAHPAEGETPVFTLAIHNAGPNLAWGVVVRDSLPPGLSHVSEIVGQGSYDAGSGTWDVGVIAAGDSALLELTRLVEPGGGGLTLNHHAWIATSAVADHNPDDDASVLPIVVQGADLALRKTVDVATPGEADPLVFSLTLNNLGPDAADGVQVTDLLPAGVTWAGDTPSQGGYVPGTGLWDVGTVAAGDSATLDIDVTVDLGTMGSLITNHAAVTLSNLPDPVAANDADSVQVAVAGIDLQVEKRVDDAFPDPWAYINYTVVAANLGLDDATGVVLADTLPAGLNFDHATPEQGSYDDATGLWDLGTLAAGDSLRLDLFAIVDGSAGGMTLTNTARVAAVDQSDPNAANDAASAAIIVAGADLALQQRVDRTVADVGDTLAYRLVAGNLGPDAVTSSGVTDLLPAELGFVDAAPSQGSYDEGAGVWNIGTLAVGDSVTLDLRAEVLPAAAGQLLENMAVVANWSSNDPVAANDSTLSTVNVGAVDLALSQSVDNSSPEVGETFTLSFLLRNLGPGDATGISVLDLWPAELEHLDHGANQGNYAPGDGRWNVGDLAAGDSLSLWIEAAALPGTGGLSIDNFAFVEAVDQGDPVAANDSSLVSLSVQASDLALNLGADVLRPEVGDTIHLTLDIENLGPNDASGIQVSGALPFGLQGLDFTASAGTFNIDTGNWSLPALATGAAAQLRLDVRVQSGSGGDDLAVSALILHADQEDPDDANDTGSVTITPRAADAVVFLDVSNDAPVAGETLDALVRFLNLGPDSAMAARVDLPLPAELELVDFTPEAGSFGDADGLWTIGDVAVGDTLELALVLRAANWAAGSSPLLEATAGALTEDPTPADGHIEIAIDIGQAPLTPIAIAVSQNPVTVHPGAFPSTLYSLGIENRGLRPARLEELQFLDSSSGPGGQDQLDGNWSPLVIDKYLSADDVIVAGGRGSAEFSGGVLRFTGLDLDIAPGDSLVLLVRGGAATGAKDADRLDLLISEPGAFVFAEPCSLIADWPLHPAGEFAIDGLSSYQLTLDGDLPVSLLSDDADILALSVWLPSNGYETDTLRKLNVANWGSALPGDDIAAMKVWTDDGDGHFEATTDTLLGPLYPTGARWENSDLSLHVPLGGRRLFVSVDIADLATAGASLRLGFPHDPNDTAVGMDSGNDGPVDSDLPGPVLQVVTADNRITLSTQTLAPISAPPGAEQVPLINLIVGNSYGQAKDLTGITLSNASDGAGSPAQLDTAWRDLQLWADDGSTSFEADSDTLLAGGFFANGRAALTSFLLRVPAEGQRRLFATANISLDRAADGDVLAAHIAGVADVIFADGTGAAGSYPLDSGRTLTIDGMVPAQIANHGAPVATVGPGEGPVLGLDLTLPANGYAADVLQHIKIVNHGNAGNDELAVVNLWADTGDDVWGAGDLLLGELAWLDGAWQSALSAIPVPEEGLHAYVTFTVSPSLGDSATVQLELPANGLTMASDNDGPLGGEIRNAELQLLSPSTLLSTIKITPPASILDQLVEVSMVVRNLSGELITGLRPGPLGMLGDGALTLVDGPSPDSLQIGVSSVAEFTWSYRAASPGQVQLTGNCSGRGDDSGLTHISLSTASSLHDIFVASDSLSLYAVEAMPFFVNQGQSGVVPVHLTFSHGSDEDASDVELRGLDLRLRDPAGGGIVPADLFSRVTVNEGGDIYLIDDTPETSGDAIDLNFTQPVLIRPGEPVTVDIQVDIAAAASVPEFFVVIEDSLAFDAVDATSSLRVQVTMGEDSFPIEAGPAQVYAPAETLRVASAADQPRSVGLGQTDVLLETLTLENPGLPSIGADVRVTGFEVAAVDSLGDTLLPANQLLERIRLVNPAGAEIHLDRMLTAEDDSVIALVPSPLVSVPAGEPVELELWGEIALDAPLLTFRLRTESSAQFDAQDANSGDPVDVAFTAPPLLGHPLRVEAGAELLASRLVSQAPDSAGVGGAELPLLSLRLRNPGGAGSAPLRCAGLTLRFWNEARDSLVPGEYFEALRARWNGLDVAERSPLPAAGGSAYLSLPDLIIAPGDSALLELEGDLEASAPPGYLEVAVDRAGWHSYDVNTGAPVVLTAEAGQDLPHLSGLIWLEEAPRDLRVGAENRMPPVLAADGEEVACLRFELVNPAGTGAGAVRLEGLTFIASDRDGQPLAIGAAAERLRVYRGPSLWAESGPLSPDSLSALVVPDSVLSVDPGPPEHLELRFVTRAGFAGASLRLGIEAAGVRVLQPANPLLAIDVRAVTGQSFPLWSGEGNFSPTDLASSYSNFPNPFAAGRDETAFVYYLSGEARVTLRVWSLRGEKVATLVAGSLRAAGLQQDDTWDGRNGHGGMVQNGVYLAEIQVDYVDGGSDRLLRKVAVLR